MASNIDEIARRLGRLRNVLRMSQAEFCREIGVAPNRWNQYERGQRQITIDVAARIRQRFGVTTDWIYFGDESGLPRRISDQFLEAAE